MRCDDDGSTRVVMEAEVEDDQWAQNFFFLEFEGEAPALVLTKTETV